MRSITLKTSAALLGMAAAIAFSPAPAAAADFSGKTITIIVPFKEGGGGDTYARLVAAHIGENLPGHPKVVVLNKPGGAGVVGAHYFNAKAHKDGLMAIVCSTSNFISQLFGGKKIKYDVTEWRTVIVNPIGQTFYARPDQTGITGKDIKADILALRKADTKLSAKSKTSAELRTILAFDMLGFFPKTIVYGLSSGKRRQANLRGELNLTQDNSVTYARKLKKWEKKGVVAPFMTLGLPQPDGTIKRDPVMPDLPTLAEAYEAVNGKKIDTNTLHWKAMRRFIAISVSTSKSLALPKGTSDDIYQTYVAAAKKTWNDPKFQEKIKKSAGRYPAFFAKDAEVMVNEALKWEPEVRQWLQDYIDKRLNKTS
jgi:tripartite-type tricarboxylate transporter receptor subunit TctC